VVDKECVRCGLNFEEQSDIESCEDERGENVFANDELFSDATLESDTQSDDSFVVDDDVIEIEETEDESHRESESIKEEDRNSHRRGLSTETKSSRRFTIASSDDDE
jgi:hypothetical protein